MQTQRLRSYQEELQKELTSILQWWTQNMFDSSQGFLGEVDANNQQVSHAPKGLVMMSRILWTFSAAYQWGKKKEHLEMADAAYKELLKQFKDETFGGFYWSVDHLGTPLAQRKQLYGQAFALYALTEYAAATHMKRRCCKPRRFFI